MCHPAQARVSLPSVITELCRVQLLMVMGVLGVPRRAHSASPSHSDAHNRQIV